MSHAANLCTTLCQKYRLEMKQEFSWHCSQHSTRRYHHSSADKCWKPLLSPPRILQMYFLMLCPYYHLQRLTKRIVPNQNITSSWDLGVFRVSQLIQMSFFQISCFESVTKEVYWWVDDTLHSLFFNFINWNCQFPPHKQITKLYTHHHSYFIVLRYLRNFDKKWALSNDV